MKKAIVICSLVIGAGWNARAQFTFKEFLAADKKFDSATTLMNDGKFKQALSVYAETKKSIDLVRTSYLYSGICWMNLGDKKKAMEELRLGFLNGALLRHLKGSTILEPHLEEIAALYKSVRQQYLNTIDTVLRERLTEMLKRDQHIRNVYKRARTAQRDSLHKVMQAIDAENLSALKEIERKYGWPGEKLIGPRQFDNTEMDWVSLIVMHNSPAEQIYFLNSAVAKAETNEASWWEPYNVMSKMLIGFRTNMPLRYTYLNSENKLDVNKSYFQLKTLADLMNNNRHFRLTFFICYYADESQSEMYDLVDALQELKATLIKHGVPPEIIDLKADPVRIEDDRLGRCRIAFITNPS